eukprot:136545-Chlamydomonas_euryale.AAC.2
MVWRLMCCACSCTGGAAGLAGGCVEGRGAEGVAGEGVAGEGVAGEGIPGPGGSSWVHWMRMSPSPHLVGRGLEHEAWLVSLPIPPAPPFASRCILCRPCIFTLALLPVPEGIGGAHPPPHTHTHAYLPVFKMNIPMIACVQD